jgi:hypothetical protein
MARIRSIKPDFFESEDVSALPLRARLTWIGLWVHCDNYGRCKDNVKLVKKNVWPLDPVSLRDVEEDLATLAAHGRIVRYSVDGAGYLAVVNWGRHQHIARPGLPKYPAPPTSVENVSRHDNDEALFGIAVSVGKGLRIRDQGGDAREPPRQCEVHAGNPNPPPCGGCRDARTAHEQWAAEQRLRISTMPTCPTHRGQLAHNCASCRADALAADA